MPLLIISLKDGKRSLHSFEVQSMIRRYHCYNAIWEAYACYRRSSSFKMELSDLEDRFVAEAGTIIESASHLNEEASSS